jgi:CubicO group peptidase (beta-lactamase class C family)
MKALLRKLSLFLTISIIISNSILAQMNQEDQLDSIITAYKNAHSIPGIATLIVKEDKIIWRKNYGYKNLQLQLPVEDSTIFLTASISKTILVTAVMQLWENGLLELGNNINAYLPAGISIVNPNYTDDSITVMMLLTHTSSLKDNWEIAPYLQTCGDSPIKLDTFLINYFMPGGRYFYNANFYNYKPGQEYNYSNTAACLLALIVENLSGKSFDLYCRDSIFIPLGMKSAYWFLEELDTNKIAKPYLAGKIPVCHQGSPIYPAGRLRINILDMMKFLNMYINNGKYNGINILNSSTVDYMLSGHVATIDSILQGLIWFKYLPFGDNIWGHDGLSTGCATFIGLNPDYKYSFIWFQNFADNNSRVGLFPILTDLNNFAKNYITGISDYPQNSLILFGLAQNYPNPFNSSTMIEYSVPTNSTVAIKVYDILGNELSVLVSENKSSGTYQLTWNSANLPSGIYFYRIKAGEYTAVKKMVLVK